MKTKNKLDFISVTEQLRVGAWTEPTHLHLFTPAVVNVNEF